MGVVSAGLQRRALLIRAHENKSYNCEKKEERGNEYPYTIINWFS